MIRKGRKDSKNPTVDVQKSRKKNTWDGAKTPLTNGINCQAQLVKD